MTQKYRKRGIRRGRLIKGVAVVLPLFQTLVFLGTCFLLLLRADKRGGFSAVLYNVLSAPKLLMAYIVSVAALYLITFLFEERDSLGGYSNPLELEGMGLFFCLTGVLLIALCAGMEIPSVSEERKEMYLVLWAGGLPLAILISSLGWLTVFDNIRTHYSSCGATGRFHKRKDGICIRCGDEDNLLVNPLDEENENNYNNVADIPTFHCRKDTRSYMKKSIENLVVVKEENLSRNDFDITLEPIVVPRTPDNEAKYRHLTFLILPILALEDNKIMVLNKLEKNKKKYPDRVFPPECFDIPGGHAVLSLVPKHELDSGLISMESALQQAYREWTEEVIQGDEGAPAISMNDLKFVGFYPHPQPETDLPIKNKELTVLLAVVLPCHSSSYQTQDSVIIGDDEVDCILTNQSLSYDELKDKWLNKDRHIGEYQFEDGLGRLLERGDLRQRIAEMKLPGKKGPISI